MPSIYDLVRADVVAKYWEDKTENKPPYVFEAFFPKRKQIGIDFSFVKGKNDAPVALVASQFDTKVLNYDRLPLTIVKGELPYFKGEKRADENLLIKMNSLDERYKSYILKNIFDDLTSLFDSAEATAERMRAQLFSTGKISYAENGTAGELDYGFSTTGPTNQVKTLTTAWSAADADPLKDILDMKNAYYNLNHVYPKYMICNQSVINALLANAKVQAYFQKLTTPMYATQERVIAYVEAETNVKIVINDAEFIEKKDEKTRTTKKFYPDNQFTFVNTSDMGETLYGATPEELDLVNGNSQATSAVVINTGVTATTWKEIDPVNVRLKVSELLAPTCPNVDKIFIVKLKTA